MASKKPEDVLNKFVGNTNLERVNTDSIMCDKILGGDLELGKYVHVWGPPGVGKTTMLVWWAVALARRGRRTLFLDAEQALEPENLIAGCGGAEFYEDDNTGLITVSRPYTFLAVEEIFDEVVSRGIFDMVVVDSISNLVPSTDSERSVENPKIGYLAVPQTGLVRKYKAMMRSTGTTIVWLNQVRSKITRFGGSMSYSGASALRHLVDINIKMTPKGDIIEDGRSVGVVAELEAEKNKRVSPHVKYPLHVIYGKGISDTRALMSVLVDSGLVTKKGGGYYDLHFVDEHETIQGNSQLIAWIREHIDECTAAAEDEGLV